MSVYMYEAERMYGNIGCTQMYVCIYASRHGVIRSNSNYGIINIKVKLGAEYPLGYV